MSGFSNPLVGGGGALVYPSIHSPDYVAGSAGWTINKDGTVEFNNGTFRGIITAGTFEGTDFVINSSGAFFYNGTPAAGNLIASIATAAGNDSFSNRYQGGVTAYCLDGGVYYAINLNNFALGAPNITFAQASTYSGPYTTQATVGQDASASLSVDATTVNVGASAVGSNGPGVNLNPVNSVNGLSATGADWSLLLTLGAMSHIANTTTSYATSGIGTISGTPTAAEYNALNTAYNQTANALNTYAGKFNSLLAELQAQGLMS